MNKLGPLFLALLASCGPTAEQTATNQEQIPANKQQAAPAAPLAGKWTVTEMDGQPLTQIFPMTASAAGNRLTINSDCVAMSWEYRQDRNMVSFGQPSLKECPRGRTLDEDRVERSIGNAKIALFSEGGRKVQLSGAGGTVTMARR